MSRLPSSVVELAVATPADLAEGPLWDEREGVLRWVDIEAGRLHRLDPATGRDDFVMLGHPVGAVALATDGLVVAAGLGLARADGTDLSWLCHVSAGRRVNDAKPDPAGRMLLGTLCDEATPGHAALYSIDRGEATEVVSATISNGLDWSPDGRVMYYVDTPLRRIDRFDYSVESGALTGRRTFLDLSDSAGRPDGLTVDADGAVWVALSGGAEVRRYRPSGTLDYAVSLPVPKVTSVCFGGAALRDLYITTARVGDHPLAGCVFVLPDSGFTGRTAYRYAL